MMIMKAYIKAIDYYLPEKTITNEELAREFPEWSAEKIASKIGISQRYIAAENETAADMAIKAAEKLFFGKEKLREEVDFILFCTQSPDYFLPTSACIIQEKLHLKTSCGALDFNLGCSGYVYGLSLAKGLIFGGVANNVLLLTGETYSKHLHPKDKSNRTIFSDAASATIISTEGHAEIGNFSLGTDGRGADNLIVHTGACRQRYSLSDIHFDENGNPVSSDHLYMNGSEIFNFTIDAVPPLIADVLKKNGIIQEEVDMTVLHQANRYMLNYLRKKMKIAEERFYYCMENVGNTVSSTLPIALKEAYNEGVLNGNVLIAGFGVGYSWGGTVLKY